MEYSLADILQFRRDNKLQYRENELLTAFRQLLRIFKRFYEECGLMHRDIKPENLLYSLRKKEYVVSDFSEARLEEKEGEEKIAGTPLYFTPENFESYMKKDMRNQTSLVENDVYALGVVFLLMKKLRFGEDLTREGLVSLRRSIENEGSLSAKVILGMTEENPNKRERYFSLMAKLQDVKEEKHPEEQIMNRVEEFIAGKGKDVRKQAENMFGLGMVLMLMCQFEKALDMFGQAKLLFGTIKEEQRKGVSMFYIGKIYYKLDLLEKSGEEIQPIFENTRKHLPEEDQEIGLEVLGLYFESKKRWVDSICVLQEIMNNIEKNQGPYAKKLGFLNEKMGDIYEKMGQNEEACRRWNESIGICKRNEASEEKINKIYDKIYKFHPSEMYEEIDSSFSSPKNRGSSRMKDDALPIDPYKIKDDTSRNGHQTPKMTPTNMNELKLPNTKQERPKKASVFSENKEHTIHEKIAKTHLISKDPEFERGLLFINRESFHPNTRNMIKFEQSPEQFHSSCLKNEEGLVFSNEFIEVRAKETAFIRKNESEYDLILEIKYENKSKISKISNIYSKSLVDHQGVFLNVQQLKGSELDSLQSVSHLVFIKFKALKFEVPVMFFCGSVNSKEICVVFRLPCTLFSKLLFEESYSIIQFKKLESIVLTERRQIIESPEFKARHGIATKLPDLLQFFPGEIENGRLNCVCSLGFKGIETKFRLEIQEAAKVGRFRIKMVYIAFGEEDFQEKRAVFFDLMKTLLFLFAGLG